MMVTGFPAEKIPKEMEDHLFVQIQSVIDRLFEMHHTVEIQIRQQLHVFALSTLSPLFEFALGTGWYSAH